MKRETRPDITKEFLTECLEKGMTKKEIGLIADASLPTLALKIKEYGLQDMTLKTRPAHFDADRLMHYTEQGIPDTKIAKRMGVTASTVGYWRRKHNLRSPVIKKRKAERCRTCKYRTRDSAEGKCDYILITGHSRNRGQYEEECSKYERNDGKKRKYANSWNDGL